MSRRSKRQDEADLRKKFVANRERVRAWINNWHFPEVEWPGFPEIPYPWLMRKGQEQMWLERHAPFMDEYWWLLEARPVTEGVSRVVAIWRFGAGHRFELLQIDIRSYADPPYLAEKLALGAHAAALNGWRDEDLRGLHAWLYEGIDNRPIGDALRGQQRIGFVLFKLLRTPASDTEIDVRLEISPTGSTLAGDPLNSAGERPTE